MERKVQLTVLVDDESFDLIDRFVGKSIQLQNMRTDFVNDHSEAASQAGISAYDLSIEQNKAIQDAVDNVREGVEGGCR